MQRIQHQWRGPLRQWAAKFIKKNQWRCDRIYEFDDLMQEAYLIFLRISEKYPHVVEPRHFMGLYKIALANWFHDQAAYMKRKNTQHVDLNADALELCLGQTGELRHAGLLSILLDEAPQELRLALALLAEHPETLRSTANHKGHRENLNMKLRRILGLSGTFDLKAALTELLFN
jgi:hypothetical protein